ncbi:MAG: C25 family cysteine peptidase [Chloroflexota bacterium]|jgi:hypothetical protein
MEQLLYFNGVNGDTGEYDLPPMTGEELFSFIRGEAPAENLNELRFRYQQATQQHLGVKEGIDPKDLAQAGWGVIFAHDADPAVKEALSDLLELRRKQANKEREYFKIYEGANGHRPGESKTKFLARQGAGPGPADPEKVPYYLLIVGDPERIPNRFQSQLDVQYAVGRIHFDTLDEYANYARSVVEAETGPVKLARDIAMFSVANPDDEATKLSTNKLMRPMFDNLKTSQTSWKMTDYFAEQATKGQLARLLGGDQTPAMLFTASHGVPFNVGSSRQLPHQGALLCQDWPGKKAWSGAIPQDHYFAGDDLSSDANLLGMIAFLFACYGAGTPRYDEFAKEAFKNKREEIAPFNFLGQLPLKMLGHSRGGALAVIGHIDRAWSYSFDWQGAGAQTEVFESTMRRLLDGHPVGSAVEYFNERYAELSTVLSDELEEIEFGKPADPFEMSGLWTANNDARGYAVIGDPAVRLPVAEEGQASSERPAIEVQPVETKATAVKAKVSTSEPAGAEKETSFTAPADFSVSLGTEALASAGVSSQVTVTTYTAADAAEPKDKQVAAQTSLAFDGDLDTVVSEGAGEPLLALHQAMVQEAIAARLAYLDLLALGGPSESE